MKLEKFKRESIADKNVLSEIRGGANGMKINYEVTAYEQFLETTRSRGFAIRALNNKEVHRNKSVMSTKYKQQIVAAHIL